MQILLLLVSLLTLLILIGVNIKKIKKYFIKIGVTLKNYLK